MNDITKKLQKLVETRKTSKIVSKQSTYKPYSRTSKNGPTTGGGDYYSGSEED